MMLIREMINQINKASIIYENESLSLPFFKEEKGYMEMIIFTYRFHFDFHSDEPSVLLGRGLKIMENGEVSFFDIDHIKLGKKELFSCGKREERTSYQDVLQSMQEMIDHDFTVESVQKYVLDFNSHVVEELSLPYWELGKEYFEWLKCLICE